MRRMKLFGPQKKTTEMNQEQQIIAAPAAVSESPKHEPSEVVSMKPQCEPLEEAGSYVRMAERYLLPIAEKPLEKPHSIENLVMGIEAAQRAAEIYKKEKQYKGLETAAALLNAAGTILQIEAEKYTLIAEQNIEKQNSGGSDCLIPHPPRPR